MKELLFKVPVQSRSNFSAITFINYSVLLVTCLCECTGILVQQCLHMKKFWVVSDMVLMYVNGNLMCANAIHIKQISDVKQFTPYLHIPTH